MANVKELTAIVDRQDPRAALAELQRRMDTDPYVFKNCHEMAHEIGHEAYKKYGDFMTALKYQDVTCGDGYLHGVIEERFMHVKDIYAELKQVCGKYGTKADRCYHGVGHGLMYYTNNDLPKALKICEMYAGRARKRCYEGAFMENFISDPDAHPSKYLDSANPMFPCPQEATVYKPFCYFYAPYYFLRLHTDDYTAAISWCDTAELGYVDACTRGVGSLAMKYNIQNPKQVETICDTATDKKAEQSCISGMASYYLTFWGTIKKLQEMCKSLESDDQPDCKAPISLSSNAASTQNFSF